MEDQLQTELIHVTCPQCNKITSFSLGSLTANPVPSCPYCGAAITVDLAAAKQDANREAHELDQSIDALGSSD